MNLKDITEDWKEFDKLCCNKVKLSTSDYINWYSLSLQGYTHVKIYEGIYEFNKDGLCNIILNKE